MSPLRHRDFRLLLIATVAMMSGFALLLPVLPLWVIASGGGEAVAGATTGVFMASTVLAQLAVPAVVRVYGYKPALLLGTGLLGLPALLLPLADVSWAVLAISLARGLGFGLVTVCGSALIAELLPKDAIAGGSGLYGLATGLPQLIGLPAGAWLAQDWGFRPVFLIAAGIPLVSLAGVALLPTVFPREGERTRWLSTVALIWRPWVVMLLGSVGYGALATFLPIVLGGSGAIALLLVAGTAMVARWLAGVVGNRMVVAGRMLAPALVTVAVGLLGFAATTSNAPLAVLAVAVFGAGFGVVQNDALVVMFTRSPAGPASVVWNVAFDAGQGLGAVAVGAVVAGTSFGLAFALLGALAAAALPLLRRAVA
ncbi:MFS transporter [Amycolatopsis cihanbeyliensis]|uniref:Putative MFS family arabinose efflux permease n=1 Tax=Amycolatopsis cihanbeyliensis TaxID=1128664 RepID=A0A542DG91_AMYCI|nr:MFS transporter [Amycolatopsis cihanbeyliensis]TQJ02099.1 putative MFS family arabinose efflux permease [Amycolatopsis cihanbeyliensis]